MKLREASRIVLELAEQNLIDPKEGSEYDKIRGEQEQALATVASALGWPDGSYR